jgi:hypothetical protein
MSAHALAAALSAIGLSCEVEAQERMVVLRPTEGAHALADATLRARVVALAADHGFTHVAVELTDDTFVREREGAAVSGD